MINERTYSMKAFNLAGAGIGDAEEKETLRSEMKET